ncbi:MAG: type I 3-dehydroquinate dehydratase [Promethearchaeota archaeon]|jgi:3-dehydroquinate dehydratase type I
MNIQICAAVTANNEKGVEVAVKRAQKEKADLIEIRMDYFKKEIDLEVIRSLTTLPLIATNRSRAEEGFFEGPEKRRINLLFEALKAGFDYIDLELMTEGIEELAAKARDKLILSYHDLTSTDYSKIKRIYEKEKAVGAQFYKIITMAKTVDDNLTTLRFVSEQQQKQENKLICFCMGKLGITSRILSPLFGSSFTYASITTGEESAPGQLTIEETKRIYKLLGF